MFNINGVEWNICFVDEFDPVLYDYINHRFSVATTDWYDKCIYLSHTLHGKFLLKVLMHELYHCYEFSGLNYDFPIYEEEIIANFIATYGEELIDLAYDLYEKINTY